MNASPSTARRNGVPSTANQQPSTSTGAAPREDDEEWTRETSTGGHPSFACDERALSEMRLAVGWILESVGFTHAAHSALEVLTDIGVRYMRKLATAASFSAEIDGRTNPTDVDVLAGYREMKVNIDEMNEYLRQVRPQPDPRIIPAFPIPITPTPIVCTPVPPELIVPPPDMAFPGLPPMSTQWLRREDLEAMIAEKERENEREAMEKRGGTETAASDTAVRKLLASVARMDGLPSFYSKAATSFGLRKGGREGAATSTTIVNREKSGEEEKKREKRRSGESGKSGRPQKQPRSSAAPSTSAAAQTIKDSSSRSGSVAPHSRAPSRSHTPSVQNATMAGPISALRDSTRPTMTNIPPAGALPPDYPVHTEGTPMRIPGLMAAFGREGVKENEEMVKKAVPSPKPPPEPLLTAKALLEASPPEDAPPTRLVQLAILRSLFSKDHDLDTELSSTLASLKTAGAARPAAAPAAAAPSQSAASAARKSVSSSRTSTPLPPPPPPPMPKLKIKPPQRPSTPPVVPPTPSLPPSVVSTPLPPIRLKINIGRRPSADTGAPSTPATPAAAAADATVPPTPLLVDDDGTSTVGPSSASTIPLLFSPATAAAVAAAASMEKEEEGGGAEGGEEDDDREGKKKKKKHKKHKKHKKSSKREEEEGGEEGRSSTPRSIKREGTVEPIAVPEGGGGLKLKIKLGPRPDPE